jgi:autotransporter-associated beta strand protein
LNNTEIQSMKHPISRHKTSLWSVRPASIVIYGRIVCFLIIIAGVILLNISLKAASATIYGYPLPSIYKPSSFYSLTINGISIPVVNYTAEYDYAEFSMSNGTAVIQVTAPTQSTITSYGISPEKLGLTGTINSNILTFAITNSQYLIISINGMKPLALGADPAETNIPPSSGTGIFNVLSPAYDADNTGSTLTSAAIQSAISAASAYGGSHGQQGIVYIPAGVYLCGNLQLQNNTALYLQGGSVIRCTGDPADYATNSPLLGALGNNIGVPGTWFLYSTNGLNVKLYGRGTVDGNGYFMAISNHFGDNLLMLNCTNCIADGITFRDAGGWGLVPAQAANLTLSNLKIFDNMSVPQDDCMDVIDSQNVSISNLLGIAGDDTLSTKTYSNYPFPGTQADNNILFTDCLLWSQYVACKVGWGVGRPNSNITFSNNVVYNCQNGLGIQMYQDGSTVQNLTFDTIDVENTTLGSPASQAWGWFKITTSTGLATNVLVRNITVRQTGSQGFLGGTTSSAIINGITFDNIYMPGSSVPASNLYDMDIFHQGFYNNLAILPSQTSINAVYLMASDSYGSTSFNAAGNWSNGHAPFPATNYVDSGFTLRTPTSGSPTFAGNSLALSNEATLALKNDGYTTTIGSSAVTGLMVDNAAVQIFDVGVTDTLAGYVALLPGGGNFIPNNGTLTISAAISGSGAFNANDANTSGAIVLSGTNSYLGGTILNNAVMLEISGSGTLGSTNCSLAFVGTGSDYGTVDLNGTSQGIGNLSGAGGTILNNGVSTASTLTVGNGNATGGNFSGDIANGAGTLALNKAGGGTITLLGADTYSGATSVNEGVLNFGAGASGMSSSLQVNTGAVCQVQTIQPVLSTNATVSIDGQLYLTNGVNLVISNLFLNEVSQTIGTWGSSSSLAMNQNDTYFSGTGILSVNNGPIITTNLSWTGSGTTANPAGGTWDGSTANMWSAWIAGDTAWVTGDNAMFGGVNGTYAVTVGAAVSANTITFTNSGYTLSAAGAQTVSATATTGSTTPQLQFISGTTNTIGANVTVENSVSTGFIIGTHGSTAGGTLNINNGGVVKQNSSNSGGIDGSGTVVNVNTGGTLSGPNNGGSGGQVSIGINSGSSCTVNVEGGAVSFGTGKQSLNVGNGGSGILTVDSGTVSLNAGAANGIEVGTGAGAGTVNLNGGMITTPLVKKITGAGTATFNFNGGTLQANAANTAFLTGLNTANVRNGGADIANNNFNITIGQALVHSTIAGDNAIDGGLTKLNAGTLTLTSSSTYNGPTTVNNGTLALSGSGSVGNSETIAITAGTTLDVSGRDDQTLTLNSGQTLTGSGSLNGTLVVSGGATINPGDTIGILTVQSNITLNGTTVMELNRNNEQPSDELVSTAEIINGGGTLTVTNLGPSLQAGDTFRLFNVPVKGFSAVNLPAGYPWANNLASNGTIQVTALVSNSVAKLAAQLAPNNLILTWPSGQTGWRLQSSHNALGKNWLDMAGSTTTNQMIIPLISTNAAIFFRLIYP